MAKAKAQKRGKNKDNSRRAKKKVSVLQTEGIQYVDWKDTTLLRRFMSERAKIRARRVTGNTAQQQKLVADAIKVAREMALVPYTNRVTTQRSNKGDRDRQGRAEGPVPRPSAPPPPRRGEEGDDSATDAAGTDEGTVAEAPATVDAEVAPEASEVTEP